MPKQSIKVDINTTVFKWLRESFGWTVEDVSKILNTSAKTIELFETGKKKPTFRQLTELSLAYKRPIATFLLSAPKEEKPKPKDYRMLPDKVDVFDKKTI
ncbi:MAG: helix-turn-helix transcriptional regulator [DPANN group archaeon]|nr:helix-turn-helix transcriptional regulator [DPANN group archaeon]